MPASGEGERGASMEAAMSGQCSVCGETNFGWGYCPACSHPYPPGDDGDDGDDEESEDDDLDDDGDADEGEFFDDVGWGP
jgi:hypothetical protein